jgi:hypothetical protein
MEVILYSALSQAPVVAVAEASMLLELREAPVVEAARMGAFSTRAERELPDKETLEVVQPTLPFHTQPPGAAVLER